MSCFQSLNVVCKHAAASVSYYLDLDLRLPDGVTITSAVASTADPNLQIELVDILAEDLTLPTTGNCAAKILPADRAILVKLAGGQESDDEVIVTVSWEQSDGDSDALDCRVLIGGG